MGLNERDVTDDRYRAVRDILHGGARSRLSWEDRVCGAPVARITVIR